MNKVFNIFTKIRNLVKPELLFVLLFFAFRSVIVAQNSTNEALQKQFIEYQQNNLQEKLFLHSDKQIYSVGEICWFKIYLVDAFFHKQLSISKIAYVEIIDGNNKPFLQAKIALNEGFGNGSFQIPAILKTGNYKIRAYTNWLKNYSADFYFENQLTIINAQKPAEIPDLTKAELYDLQFFPEGGNLVNGLTSKVAFHITDQNGVGQTCKGVIVNEKIDTLSKFSSLKFGMGSFIFTPNISENYIAYVTLSNGKVIKQTLPIVNKSGIVMSLKSLDDKQINVNIRTTNYTSNVFLLVHTKGVLKQIISKSIINNQAAFLIDKGILGEGISHFTVFNAERKPICERLYFKMPENNLQIDLNLNNKNFGLREKVNVDITTKTKNNQPLSANLSMAVYQIDSLQSTNELDINSYLWLCSDLKGNIESPEYYLNNNNEKWEEATENLMLTHGWSRFNWNNILQGDKPGFNFLPEYAGHIVTGKITNAKSEVAKNLNTFISMPGTRTQFHQSVTNKEGIFNFDIKDFYNEGQVIVQSANADSTYNYDIFSPFSDQFSSKKMPSFPILKPNSGLIEAQVRNAQIQNMYSKGKLNKFIYPNIDTTAFFVQPETTYLLDNYVRFTTMEEVLREYVLPIAVRKRKDKFQLNILDNQKISFFETDPLLLLDGVPIFDTDKFMAYNPLKIRKLEVVTGTYFLGNMTFDGIANFITYTGDIPGFEIDPHAAVVDYEGIQLQREFYSPKYDSPQQKAHRLPDFRSLLYWNPTIITNANAHQNLTFFTSDQAGKYLIIIQGISPEGISGFSKTLIEVK